MNVNVRREVVRCAKCTHKNEFLYISDFAYGERLALYDKGRKYAYINLLEDEVYTHFIDMLYNILEEYHIDITKEEQQVIVNNIFKITCDNIGGKEVEFSGIKNCDNCGAEVFEDLLAEPEQVVHMDLPSIEHNQWNRLSEDEKNKLLINVLKKQNII